MQFALFKGCKIPYYMPQYAQAAEAVLNEFDIELIEIEFNCCGYPVRNVDLKSFLVSAARNLALAEEKDLNILTLCKCCYGSLMHAAYILKEDNALLKEINKVLGTEGLEYKNKIQVKHLLSVLAHDVGSDTIIQKIKNRFNGLKIAASYGCHALRPGNVVQLDDPHFPTIFENLVGLTGAESVSWEKRTECCGNPLFGKNNSLALEMMKRKIDSAKEANADFLCSACTYCQMQFDTVQSELMTENGNKPFPSRLLPQLLGLSMGIDGKDLGIDNNAIDINSICDFLS